MDKEQIDKDLGTILQDLKLELIDYVNKRLKWAKLTYYSRLSKILTTLIFGILITVAVFIVLFFSLIGLALYIGRWFGDPFLGFLAMSIVGIIILLAIIIFRKQLGQFVLNKTVLYLLRIEKDDEGNEE